MATAQPEDDKSTSSTVSNPVLAKRNTKFNQTDGRKSNIPVQTEEVTELLNTNKEFNTSLSDKNLDKFNNKTRGATSKQSVASLIAALETPKPSYAPSISPRKTSTQNSQSYKSLERKSTIVSDALPRQDQDLSATLPKPNNTTEAFCDTPLLLPSKDANLPTPPPRPYSTSKTAENLLPKQDSDISATPPPRPYSTSKTAENLLPKQDSDISAKADFSNGCDFCGKPDDNDTDAALCKVCQQYYCLACLKSHQKCNSTKDHEIAYKFDLHQQNDDDEMSSFGMSDEYKSLGKAADTHDVDLNSGKERFDSNSSVEDQYDSRIPIQFCKLCDTATSKCYIEEAIASCNECDTTMCTRCLKVHQQDKNKQHHKIDNLQQMKNTALDKCKLHPEWDRRYFCKSHTEIICIKCKVDEKHEDCTEFIHELHKVSSGQNIDKGATDRKLDELTCLSDELSRINDTFSFSLEDIGIKKRDFKEKIKIQQSAMESQVNLAVTSGINILDDHLELLKHKGIENQNIKCLLQRQINEFDKLLKSGSKEEIFIRQLSTETAVLKFRTILKELQSPVNIGFKMTEKSEIDGLIKESEDAKELIVKEKLTTQRPFSEREAVFTTEVSLSNFMTTNVVGMEMLHDETLLICNKSTKEIAMFDNEFKLTCALKLKSAPTSMAVVSNGSIIVALPTEKCLQHVNVDNKQKLSVVKTVKTKLPCLQISPFKMDLVAVVKDALCNCIVKLDIDGSFRTTVFIDKHGVAEDGILQNIQCMTANQDHNIIYITEQDQGCIGISMEGDTVFKYKSDSSQVYTGICTDYCGNVYLAEKKADSVVVVNSNGEKVKDIVTMQKLQPEFVKFNHTYDRLVIQSSSITSKIKVFTLI